MPLPRSVSGPAWAYIDPPGTTPTDRQSYGSPMERLGLAVISGPADVGLPQKRPKSCTVRTQAEYAALLGLEGACEW